MPDRDPADLTDRALQRYETALVDAGNAPDIDEHHRYLRLAELAIREAAVHARRDATAVQRARLDVDRQTLDELRAGRAAMYEQRGEIPGVPGEAPTGHDAGGA